MTLLLRVTARAAVEIERADHWWRENRPAAPGAIKADLQTTFDLLLKQPGIGQKLENPRLAGLRRLHLDRVRYHLYYRVKDNELVVLSMWHASRREPKL